MFDSHWCKRCYNDFIMKLVSVIDSEALVEILRDKTNDRLLLDTAVSKSFTIKIGKEKVNPNKAGLFEGSFFWEVGQFALPPLFIFKKNISNINITLYNY